MFDTLAFSKLPLESEHIPQKNPNNDRFCSIAQMEKIPSFPSIHSSSETQSQWRAQSDSGDFACEPTCGRANYIESSVMKKKCWYLTGIALV